MSDFDRTAHWQNVYSTKGEDEAMLPAPPQAPATAHSAKHLLSTW